MNGTRSQPTARSVPRNAISIGRVTQHSVIMTNLVEGGVLDGGLFVANSSVDADGSPANVNDVAWRAVDNLDTRIDPTLPGKPMVLMSRQSSFASDVRTTDDSSQ